MIKLVVYWCFLVATVFGGVIPAEDDSVIRGTIIGGNNTKIESVPYQVAFLHKTRFMCGGVIITNKHVITAGHCVHFGYDSPMFNIQAGSDNRKQGGVVIGVKNVFLHPKFAMLDYDIAVVELLTPLNFTQKIKAIKVGNAVPADGELVKVSGWGQTQEHGGTSLTLQSVTVPMINWKICQKNYNSEIMLTDRMICAGVEGKDACYGDSGGPLTYKDQLVGVVSTGSGCGRKGFPGIYTNIAQPEIREFIKKIAKV